MFSFKPLQKLLIDKDMTKTEFTAFMGISSSTAAKIWNNEYIAMKIIDDICNKLECRLEDVVIHVPNKSKDDPQ